MRKKQVYSIILIGLLAANGLSGSADTTVLAASAAETAAEEDTEIRKNLGTESLGENKETGENDTVETDEISLETIAKLNGVAVNELNTVFDEDGNLSFLGNRISEDIIRNQDEAFFFITEKLVSLLHLDGITLAEEDSYTSPHTGITYYRFSQTLSADIEAKMPDGTFDTLSTDIEYLTNSLKLGVDADGYPVVLASDLSYEDLEFDGDTFLTPEEAEAVVTTAYPDAYIYTDATALALWEDVSAETYANDAAAAVVYLVYADNPDLTDDSGCSPYICYEVRADGDVNYDSNGIVAELAADSLSTYSYTTIDNTSLAYFDDMEDVGEYTYTVNFDWMPEADREAAIEYAGVDSIEITVPVMRCKTDGLYYLGCKEHYISMSNAVDFCRAKGDWAKLNAYVTDDPEDPDSWHFEKAENEELSCTYADDPNYVLASFAEYVKIIDTFGENFGMYESYPSDSYMLLTYTYDEQEMMNGDTYPAEQAGFRANASNGGRMYDWNAFYTSPNLGLCLDDVVMSHEFTHGVNQHFTNCQYANEPGAVMEALADMVGYQMAAEYLNPQLAGEEEWLIGGTYGSFYRNLSNPLSMQTPEYKGGLYYVNPVDSVIITSGTTDHGGVHKNSLIPCFLGTQIVNGTTETGEKALTLEESLNMWFEVLYLSNYSTDFVNLGADLSFAAKALGFSEEEQRYVNRLIQEYGFADGTVDPELLEAENSELITIRLDYEDTAVGEEYFFNDVNCDMLTNDYVLFGGFEDNMDQTVRILKDTSYPQLIIFAQSEQEIRNGTSYQGYLDFEDMGDVITFHVKKTEVPAGEKMILGKNETLANLISIEVPGQGENSIESYLVEKDDSTGETSIYQEYPALKIIVTTEDDAAEGEYNLYLVAFE